MITFLSGILILVLAYFTHGRYLERVFRSDPNRKVPSQTLHDGVDYLPLPKWKTFMIQFLNIAGLGPIFGAIMGAKYGASSYLWIVFGCIFAGSVHDYLSGMVAVRTGGKSLSETIGVYMGKGFRKVMRVFTCVLLILVGVVFASGPAGLLADLTPNTLDMNFWLVVIFLYYIASTLLPIDKIIGKIYPVFGFTLLFMAVGIFVSLIVMHPAQMPELWQKGGLDTLNGEKVFPMMFISIACGAISGFHATQSPMMARCITNEKQGRSVFYGAMIVEGIVALIWAAAANYFFRLDSANLEINNAAAVVNTITRNWLGTIGGILAILGVVAAPITTGDTAFRSSRIMIADMLHMEQHSVKRRLMICVPLFVIAFLLLFYTLKDAEGFNIIWRYFSWSNQVMATVTLWALSIGMYAHHRNCLITVVPAVFMTMVSATYIFYAPEGLSLGYGLSLILGGAVTVVVVAVFLYSLKHLITKTVNPH